jgi:peroxiredoxin
MMRPESGLPHRTHPTKGQSMLVSTGDPAPDIVLVDHEGEPWRLHDHRGRNVVLIFHRHLM